MDFLKKASKRLEAAPQADLDRWVVELERIMGTKLDGELEKEGCCTFFVTRVSVAFDDLKWNAKTAENLFRRAQTARPSEAKVWKEAFEALLKDEIERAYHVPLVLIPAEALTKGRSTAPSVARSIWLA